MESTVNTHIGRALRDLAYCGAVFAWSFVALALLLTGVVLTASLVFLGVGVLIWIAFVYAARLTTRVDRSLAGRLRGRPIAAAYERPPARGFMPLLKTLTSDRQTWKDMGWLGLSPVLGITVGLPVLIAIYGVTQFGALGLLFLAIAPLFARGFATAHAALAARVLGPRVSQPIAIPGGMNNMSTTTTTAPVERISPAPEPSPAETDRYAGIPQYSKKKIFGVWAAAAIPMGLLSWVVAPLTKDWFHGPQPLIQSLLVWLTVGLVWQFVLVVILLRQELDSFTWPRIKHALWLHAPRHPKTRKVGGKVWWWAGAFTLAFAVWGAMPALPAPENMDFLKWMGSDAGQDFLSGAWGWFAIISAMLVFNTVLGEELLFRGLLLPRMRGAFGERDWVANGAIFTLYHLHMPWLIPLTFVDGIFFNAYPSKRFQSAWMGIIVHSAQTVVVLGLTLVLVLS